MKNSKFSLFACILALVAVSFQSCTKSDPLVVKTEAGLVKGIEEMGVEAFYGIPYARAERFMPPTKTETWDTVMVCDHYGPVCCQASQPDQKHILPMSEDCQVLNVWTKNTNPEKKMPVMVWIHGGGYSMGTSSWNPGMGIAAKDVVFVSLHHRLNILGFLDLSACGEKYKNSGNQSMLDIVAALEWVRDNISAFGGDPSNVTIVGHSGGGGKVGTLMCMPAAKDLFNRAIVMSGTFHSTNTRELTRALGLEVLNQLGISPEEVDKIKDVSYEDLVAAGNRAQEVVLADQAVESHMFIGFCPTPDGEVVAQLSFSPDFAPISNGKPLMVGTSFNEFTAYPGDLTMDEAKAKLQETLGEDTDRYIESFMAAWPDSKPADMLAVDNAVRPVTIEVADAASKSLGAPVYNYIFNCKAKNTHVAKHGPDVNFAFNIPWNEDDYANPDEDETRLADIMSQAWVNFATTGDPNVEGQPAWHPYTEENGECYIFQPNIEVKNNFDREYQSILSSHHIGKLPD